MDATDFSVLCTYRFRYILRYHYDVNVNTAALMYLCLDKSTSSTDLLCLDKSTSSTDLLCLGKSTSSTNVHVCTI